MANFYVSSTGWAAVPQWAPSTAYTVGQYVRQLATPVYGDERVFKCTTAGTSLATEPAWSKNDGATTTESGGPVWTQVAGRESEQLAGNWRAPYGTLLAFSNAQGSNNGVQVFVSSDHVESSATAPTFGNGASGNPSWTLISVNKAGSLPPVAADIQRGALIKTTGNNGIIIANSLFRGFDFICGDGTSSASLVLGRGNNSLLHCEDCSFSLGGSGAGAFTFGSTSSFPGSSKFVGCVWKFNAAGQSFSFQQPQNVEIVGGSVTGTVVPTFLFTFPTSTPNRTCRVHGVDLSFVTTRLFNNNNWFGGLFEMWDCKLSASVALTAPMTPSDPLSELRMVNCDDATNGRNYRFFQVNAAGQVFSDAQVVRTGGASDGTTPFSHKLILNNVNGSNFWGSPAIMGWVSRRLNTVGSPVTLSMEALIFSFGHALTNADFWMEVETLDNAGVPLASFYTTRAALLGAATALDASTSGWDTAAPLRANSTSYAAYSVVRVAGNPGRVFMNNATNTGLTGAAEPAGMATATDGGSPVVDNFVQWYAGSRVKFSLVITPRVKGLVRARLVGRYGGAINNNCVAYVDQKLNVA